MTTEDSSTIRISKEIIKKMKKEAIEQNISIREYIEKKLLEHSSDILEPSYMELSLKTTEDWLLEFIQSRRNWYISTAVRTHEVYLAFCSSWMNSKYLKMKIDFSGKTLQEIFNYFNSCIRICNNCGIEVQLDHFYCPNCKKPNF